MDLIFYEGQDMKEFLVSNRNLFEEYLLKEAVNVRDKIDKIHRIGNINLINNAHKLVLFIVEEKTEDVVQFAEQEGVAWAKHSLTLAFKLEWVHAIRRTLWHFLYLFDEKRNKRITLDRFYIQESKINDQIDQFLNAFFISYSKFKDELIEKQRRLVENLSVPIIPITSSICVLPLIGSVDYYRASIIEEQVLMEIGKLRISTLIMDFSGIVDMEEDTISQILKVIDGIGIMGCKPVLTGIRPELVRKFMKFGRLNAETKGTLQQTLSEYMNEFSQ
ncbi:Anti-anti-sigma regulatory factor (antagonist of anti-sigma factor) [Salinibacillus kushneri]|uniref:Anti-anti-sigma regulatory factor (Antagonist of anti-sigma factor) n=1 Tax=Salinibacillus kushneri TaxID=237682 RepID=A0A1I0CNN5_9BACI|nr:STAS domain-containing protein [Salinibacillus kushneri]SET21211.1 Anti-anti-sigma regulatory factor (antagonist of anti-sigma factor) [Salinibacillus kushneri]